MIRRQRLDRNSRLIEDGYDHVWLRGGELPDVEGHTGPGNPTCLCGSRTATTVKSEIRYNQPVGGGLTDVFIPAGAYKTVYTMEIETSGDVCGFVVYGTDEAEFDTSTTPRWGFRGFTNHVSTGRHTHIKAVGPNPRVVVLWSDGHRETLVAKDI